MGCPCWGASTGRSAHFQRSSLLQKRHNRGRRNAHCPQLRFRLLLHLQEFSPAETIWLYDPNRSLFWLISNTLFTVNIMVALLLSYVSAGIVLSRTSFFDLKPKSCTVVLTNANLVTPWNYHQWDLPLALINTRWEKVRGLCGWASNAIEWMNLTSHPAVLLRKHRLLRHHGF